MGACIASRGKMKKIVLNSSLPKNTLNLHYRIKTMLFSNHLLNISITNFKDNLTSAISSSNILSEQINNFIKFLNLPKLQQQMLKNVLEISTVKLSLVFPEKFVLESCCYIIFYFLSKKNKENRDELNKFLYYLIKTCQQSSEGTSDEYKTGKLSFLILNLVIFLTFIMLFFFISYGILEAEEFSHDKIEVIYIDKLPVKNVCPKSFSSYIFTQIKKYNPDFNREKLCIIAIQYIFDPLKECNS